MHRSSKTVDEVATKLTVGRRGVTPDLGMAAAIELAGRDAGGECVIRTIGKAFA